MLVGRLSDILSPARKLVEQLNANAGVQTQSLHHLRVTLDELCDLTGSIWEQLGQIREEIADLK